MNVSKFLVSGAMAAACILGFHFTAQAQAEGAKQTATASASNTQYKLGIVDRRAVLQGYKKVAAERQKLEADVEAKNAEIDKFSERLKVAKDTYDKEKDSLSQSDREEREAAFQKELIQYQSMVQTQQAEIDNQERMLMKKFFGDIDDAVKSIGDSENYHLIIDGSKGSSTLFYAEAMNISQKVVDYLNANSK